MDGLPVVIRLIDPPLHEFLPNLEEQLVKVTKAEDAGGASEEDKELLTAIRSMHEQNPMLGLRGCRLGLMIPDFVKIQTRAILQAQIAVKRSGGNPIAKIMIPLVGHVNELAAARARLRVVLAVPRPGRPPRGRPGRPRRRARQVAAAGRERAMSGRRRWDDDPRGIGPADARTWRSLVETIAAVADEDGWVAEE